MSERFLRFCTVGIFNTMFGYAVICFGLLLGFGDFSANFLGYGCGLLSSFVLNRSWTFSGRNGSLKHDFLGFLAVWLVSYSANLAVIGLSHAVGWIGNPFVHLAGLATFTGIFFLFSNRFVFNDRKTFETNNAHIADIAGTVGLILIGVLTFYQIRNMALTHDVVWQLWIARQMLGGAILYKDIWELNPPLWFWSALPVEIIAELLHIAPSKVLIAAVVVAGLASAGLVGQLVATRPASRRFCLMFACFWVCVPLPLFDFGQREQLALIGALPYGALVARRREGGGIPVWLSLSVSLLAAYAFALKHYFVVIPLMLELWLFLGGQRRWHPLRPELVVLAICAGLYVLAAMIWAPEFFTHMVPMVTAAYHGYEAPIGKLFDEASQVIWFLGLISLLLYGRVFGRRTDPLVSAWLIVCAGFAFAYFVQLKGWQYHAIPVTGALLVAIFARITLDGVGHWVKYPMGLLTIALAVFVGIRQGPYQNWLRGETEALLRSAGPDTSVAVLAADPMFAWPMVDEMNQRWPLHVYAHWMLPAIGGVALRSSDPARMKQLAAEILEQTAQDLKCDPPVVLLIERREHSQDLPIRYFDVRSFFLSDPVMRDLLDKHYREVEGTRLFAAYRIATRPARPVHGCLVRREARVENSRYISSF